MKINILYDQGTARVAEDSLIFCPPRFFGAADGVSGIYLPQKGPRLFDGKTGGQLVSQGLSTAFYTAGQDRLEDILKETARALRQFATSQGLSIDVSELLPSAAFTVAKIGHSRITILQGGDSLAVWELKDGKRGGTQNKMFLYEKYLLDTIAMLMEKHQGDRQGMWEEFRPILAEKRRANINKPQGGFAILNGQPEFEQFWQKFSFKLEEMKLLILFSDGFVPFEWTEYANAMADCVIHFYRQGGLPCILDATREIAEKNKSASHEDFAEATAIAIEF